MNQKPNAIDYIVVITKALLTVLCVSAICAAMFYKNYSDPATLSALFLLTGTLVSGLRGSAMMIPNPFKAEVTNSIDKPVPVSESAIPVAQTKKESEPAQT